MEWDKFSEKALLKLLPIFLIIKSIQIIWKNLKTERSQKISKS
jgi:hypothetical protein